MSLTFYRTIKIEVDIENIKISAKQATPIGLIINEMITNSFKYAFPEKQNGMIKIIMNETNGHFELRYMDSGIGVPEDIDLKHPTKMGLRLIKILSEGHLDGSIQLFRDQGTCFIIHFDRDENVTDNAS